MAFEDCEVLALFLQHYLQEDPNRGFIQAAKQYSDLRQPRLNMVFKKAQQLAGMKQDMSVVEEMFMYLFVWIFSVLGVAESYERKLRTYDVPKEVLKAIGKSD
jgi:hypothetical protein